MDRGDELKMLNWQTNSEIRQQEAKRPGETNARMPSYRKFIPRELHKYWHARVDILL